MTSTASNRELAGRDDLDDVDAILSLTAPGGDLHESVSGGLGRFTWDYARDRDALVRLYEKAKTSQWNSTTDLPWDTVVDQEAAARHLVNGVDGLILRAAAESDPDCPLHGWSPAQFERLGFERQSWALSQSVHGEQGALVCTAKISVQVPWIDAKYYAATQVADEARHVEVFSRYLDEKLEGTYPVNPHLLRLLDDIMADDRWDMTYLGMQIMIEGLALAAFSAMQKQTNDPLLEKLLRYVMADEARHVAFGVVSLSEVYQEMSAAELRERQEFAFVAGLTMRDRFFSQDLWERLDVDPAAMLRWQLANTPPGAGAHVYKRVIPNLKKLGLLDAGDGWLRQKYEEMGVIRYEDWEDTASEYDALDAVAVDRASRG